MKRTLAGILAVLMLCAGFALADTESAAGDWEATVAFYDGQEIELSTVGITWTMTLHEDGTCTTTMTYAGVPMTETDRWIQTGSEVSFDSGTVMTLADGKLTVEQDDILWTFVRTGAAPADGQRTEGSADITGHWTGIEGRLAGEPLVLADVDFVFEIDFLADGTYHVYSSYNGEETALDGIWSQDGGALTISGFHSLETEGDNLVLNVSEEAAFVLVRADDAQTAAAPAATQPAEAGSAAGSWVLTRGEMGTSTIDPATLGMASTLVLNEDGSVYLTTTQSGKTESFNGRWSQNGSSVNVDGLAAELKNGELRIEASGIILVYERAE